MEERVRGGIHTCVYQHAINTHMQLKSCIYIFMILTLIIFHLTWLKLLSFLASLLLKSRKNVPFLDLFSSLIVKRSWSPSSIYLSEEREIKTTVTLLWCFIVTNNPLALYKQMHDGFKFWNVPVLKVTVSGMSQDTASFRKLRSMRLQIL